MKIVNNICSGIVNFSLWIRLARTTTSLSTIAIPGKRALIIGSHRINSAVQLAAAITASARMYMYPHISREDCYYTDTDSVVLSNPLSEDIIYPSELGKFKLEDKILNGYFLAPKAYCYFQIDGKNVVRFKGPAKNLVNPEWFESQYADLSRTKQVIVESHFRVDWHKFNIIRKETLYTLGLPLGKKRKLVFQGQTWVDTEPIHIIDLSRLDHIGKQVIKSLRIELKQLKIENVILNEKFLMKERELEERYKEMKNTSISMLTTERSLTEERTLFDNMDEAENHPDEKTENQIPNTLNRRRCTTFQDIMDKNVTSETDDEDADQKPQD